MTDLLEELAWRGLIHDQTPALAERLTKGPVKGYIGFDPTASSLQIGNLVVVMLLAHLQRAGGSGVESLARDPPLTESQIIEYPEGLPV